MAAQEISHDFQDQETLRGCSRNALHCRRWAALASKAVPRCQANTFSIVWWPPTRSITFAGVMLCFYARRALEQHCGGWRGEFRICYRLFIRWGNFRFQAFCFGFSRWPHDIAQMLCAVIAGHFGQFINYTTCFVPSAFGVTASSQVGSLLALQGFVDLGACVYRTNFGRFPPLDQLQVCRRGRFASVHGVDIAWLRKGSSCVGLVCAQHNSICIRVFCDIAHTLCQILQIQGMSLF